MSVPRPFASMLPPSRTTSRFIQRTGKRRQPSLRAARAGTASSFCQLEYFAHPLKWKRTMVTSGCGLQRRTKMGPKSRVHPRFVANRKNPSGTSLVSGGVYQNAYLLTRNEVAHYFAIDPRDRSEFAKPIAYVMWPANPSGFVRFHSAGKRTPSEFVVEECDWVTVSLAGNGGRVRRRRQCDGPAGKASCAARPRPAAD